MEKDEITLSKRFLNLRNKLSLTQQEAADLFRVHLTSWQAWEYGVSSPHQRHLKLLEEYEIKPPKLPAISDMCRIVRNRLKLKKLQMADIFGVQPNTWGYWERGVMKPIGEHKERIERMFKEIEEKGSLQKAS